MTGQFFLDWAAVTVSLFNTILLLWLGITVLLNAERRTWGIWLAGGGLLTGSVFFVSHSAILGRGLDDLSRGLDFWWHVGWIPVIALPFAWYVMMLWYAGFWDLQANDPSSRPDRGTAPARSDRHLFWLGLTGILAVALAGWLFLSDTLPPFGAVARLEPLAPSSRGAALIVIVVYPLYILLCNALSLSVLRRPGPSARVMGDLARRRARPWLTGASLVLLLVSLLVAWVMLWTILNLNERVTPASYYAAILTVTRFDLAIASLIAVAVILLGQAIVSYEIFTGKTLPRRGFRRYWQRAVVLAAGYGTTVGWTLVLQLRPIYSFLLAIVLITAFYALLSWRSFAERERTIDRLRPFVTSDRLYEQLLARSTAASLELDVVTPFRALCDEVLGTRTAHLAALGPLAALVGLPLSHPPEASIEMSWLAPMTASLGSPETTCVPVDPAGHGGVRWVVPLWSERGLIGALLLGDKQDGGLYTQEEMEIARAAGERLIDMQAGAEMARRLMALQRQRLTETQVLDGRTRRVLHDDVLPQLHTTLLSLTSSSFNAGSASEGTNEAVAMLTSVHRQISDLLRDAPVGAAPDVARLGPLRALRQTVEDGLGAAFDEVIWEIEPEAEPESISLPALTGEVLFYAAREVIRNAARHGRPTGGTNRTASRSPLHLRISAGGGRADGLRIVIEDDGVGLEPRERPTEGSGQGLALHSTMMAIVGGSLTLDSVRGEYTRVRLTAPGAASSSSPLSAASVAPGPAGHSHSGP